MDLSTATVVALLAYLLGAVPSGLIVGRVVAGLDIRQYGSGKSGATNVARTVGWGPAAIVLFADVLKGLAAIYVGRLLVGPPGDAYPLADAIAAGAALVGHNWPVYVGFRGGRGVATGMGTILAVSPAITAIGVLIGLLVMLATDIVSIGSVVAVAAAFFLSVLWVALGWLPSGYIVYATVVAGVIILRHGDNIVRVFHGQERRLGLRPRLAAALRHKGAR